MHVSVVDSGLQFVAIGSALFTTVPKSAHVEFSHVSVVHSKLVLHVAPGRLLGVPEQKPLVQYPFAQLLADEHVAPFDFKQLPLVHIPDKQAVLYWQAPPSAMGVEEHVLFTQYKPLLQTPVGHSVPDVPEAAHFPLVHNPDEQAVLYWQAPPSAMGVEEHVLFTQYKPLEHGVFALQSEPVETSKFDEVVF
jgi:hypothetical protein